VHQATLLVELLDGQSGRLFALPGAIDRARIAGRDRPGADRRDALLRGGGCRHDP